MPAIALCVSDPALAGRVRAVLGGRCIDPARAVEHAPAAALVVGDLAAGDVGTRIAQLRELAVDRPLLVLAHGGSATRRADALYAGADDVMPADGEPCELVARAVALSRRAARPALRLAYDDLSIDLVARRVSRAGCPVNLPSREYDLLVRLARSANQAVSRAELWQSVWRLSFDPGTNRIDVHMARLRQRIDRGHAHSMLRTVRGVGYALVTREAVSGGRLTET